MALPVAAKTLRVLSEDRVFADNAHIMVCGLTGSGKSNFIETIALDKWLKNYKVIFFDLFKYECCQLGFPETGEMARVIRRDFPPSVPRGYPHKVLVPFVVTRLNKAIENTMQMNLPKHNNAYIEEQKKKGIDAAYTVWQPFKLSFLRLDPDDLVVMMKAMTQSGTIATDFLMNTQDFQTMEELISTMVGLASKQGLQLQVGFEGYPYQAQIGKPEVYQALLRLFSRIQRSGLICNEKNQYVLDLEKEMESDEITTFSFANIDDRNYKFMVFVSIMRQIIDLRAAKRFKKELLLVIPEAPQFAPRKVSISPEAIGGFSSLTIMQLFSAQARILGVTMICDMQIPQQLDNTVMSNFGWVVLGTLHEGAVAWINDNVIRIPEAIKDKISGLQVGVFCVLQVGTKDYSYPAFTVPCRARHRRRKEDVILWTNKRRNVEVIPYQDHIKNPLYVQLGKGREKATSMSRELREKKDKVLMDKVELFIERKMKPEAMVRELGVSRNVVNRVLGLIKTKQ